MLTDKDHKAVIGIILSTKYSFPPMRWSMREEHLIKALAKYMAQDNPDFDQAKFLEDYQDSVDAIPREV